MRRAESPPSRCIPNDENYNDDDDVDDDCHYDDDDVSFYFPGQGIFPLQPEKI